MLPVLQSRTTTGAPGAGRMTGAVVSTVMRQSSPRSFFAIGSNSRISKVVLPGVIFSACPRPSAKFTPGCTEPSRKRSCSDFGFAERMAAAIFSPGVFVPGGSVPEKSWSKKGLNVGGIEADEAGAAEQAIDRAAIESAARPRRGG